MSSKETLTESMRRLSDLVENTQGDCPKWYEFLRKRARKKSLEPIPFDTRGDNYSPWDPLYWLGLNTDPDSSETCARAWKISQEDWDSAGEAMAEMLERVGGSGQSGGGIGAFFMASRRISEFEKAVDKAYTMWKSEQPPKTATGAAEPLDQDLLPPEDEMTLSF